MIADEFIQGPPQSNNITFVKATLGRKATIKCVAQNLVGQKTVSLFLHVFIILQIWNNFPEVHFYIGRGYLQLHIQKCSFWKCKSQKCKIKKNSQKT